MWVLLIVSCCVGLPVIIVANDYNVKNTANQMTMDSFNSLHSVTSCTMLNTSIVITTLHRGCTDIAGSNTLVCNTATSWVTALNPWNNNQSNILSGLNLLNVNGLSIPDALAAYNMTFPNNSTFQCYITRPTRTTHTDCEIAWQKQPNPPLEWVANSDTTAMIVAGVLAAIGAAAAVAVGLELLCRQRSICWCATTSV